MLLFTHWPLGNVNSSVKSSILNLSLNLTNHYLNQCRLWSVMPYGVVRPQTFNTLRPRQNGHHFADDMFKCIFLNENVCIPIGISLKFVPKVPMNNIPSLVQIMAWRRPGNKTLSEAMMVRLPTHICITLPQWVNKHTLESLVYDASF